MSTAMIQTNSKLDLVMERVVDVPRELVWAAWTKPEHIKKWFTPAPWTTVDCEIDLRPGGIFRTVMRSPEGQESPHVGCYLEIVPNEKLVWTSALGPAYRPAIRAAVTGSCDELYFTAVITLEAQGARTKYTAVVLHGDEESTKKHEAMGFHEGWGAALDQLVALARTL
ncbi:MAG: putative glutathione S-transferase-related transrane protein [Bryobacterales bacterium]|nr:putative glutathione S-transferase-related transrane protein [Bryobacterales bacterium]